MFPNFSSLRFTFFWGGTQGLLYPTLSSLVNSLWQTLFSHPAILTSGLLSCSPSSSLRSCSSFAQNGLPLHPWPSKILPLSHNLSVSSSRKSTLIPQQQAQISAFSVLPRLNQPVPFHMVLADCSISDLWSVLYLSKCSGKKECLPVELWWRLR